MNRHPLASLCPALCIAALPLAIALGPGLSRAAPAAHAASTPSAPSVHSATAMPREGKVQLPFIEDDYPRALSEARSRGVPLFVDAGAPWCHTCRSMQAFVFTDPAIAGEAGRFVWLEINTERANNVTFVKKYPVPALPTYFVIDPVSERAALRWVGGTSVQKMIAVLEDGREMVRAARDSHSGTAAAGGASGAFQAADRTFARAESLYAVPQDSLAAEAYLEALALAAPGWKHDSRAVESCLFALTQSGLNARAARLAIESLPRLGRSTSSGNIVGTGLEAALEVPASDPARAGMIQTLEQAAKSIAADRTIDMAADDRSGVYIALLDARHDANDDAGAHQVASDWATFLEGEAARATTADARAVFDPHRLSAYIELGQPERAIPMLEASERALPDDYDPPARLAIAYREMKRWQDALAASDRALEKAYGPRTLGMYQVRTDIYLGMGDTLQARSTLQHAIQVANGFPPGQRPQRTIATLEQRLTALR